MVRESVERSARPGSQPWILGSIGWTSYIIIAAFNLINALILVKILVKAFRPENILLSGKDTKIKVGFQAFKQELCEFWGENLGSWIRMIFQISSKSHLRLHGPMACPEEIYDSFAEFKTWERTCCGSSVTEFLNGL